MLAALAAVTIGTTAPVHLPTPEVTEARGYALVFSREDHRRFTVFVKDAGAEWSEVPKVESKSEDPCSFDWLVFHAYIPNVDFAVRTFESRQEGMAARPSMEDLMNYFEDDEFADNNFGLHDIY